jgi:CheY-like chemotaxis protein
MDARALIQRIRGEAAWRDLPVILRAPAGLAKEESSGLRRLADRVLVKGSHGAHELLAETSLFLHRPESNLSDDQKKLLRTSRPPDAMLAGRRVLVVDDDVRNVFAITSMLERQGIIVRYATNGREAVDGLLADPDVDAVLMDIMMPEMDGYETTAEIRRTPSLAGLPIIALTAKAMQGDREKCLAAGASDYLAKPVEADQLLSLLRVWISR